MLHVPRRPHGVRATFQDGCRCRPCKVANAVYRRTPLVDAAPARAHLLQLAVAGVGQEQAAALSGVAVSGIRRIRRGGLTWIRQSTADRLLAIPPRLALGARVPAIDAHRKIRQLRIEHFSLTQIARATGKRTPRLQLGRKKITLRTALTIVRLHRQRMSVGDASRFDRRADE